MGKSVGKRGFAAMDGFFLLSVAVFLVTTVGAQPGTSPSDGNQLGYARFSPSMAVIIVVLIAALFFMGFFSIYIRHCSVASGAGGSVRRALSMRNRRAAARGLEASVLETFPTFSYSEVKDHKIGKGALECAVCLNEFEENETLRLIPKCDHVFHPECIDAWLESHVTCPVCRANLVPQAGDQSAQASDSANDATPQANETVERINSTTSRNEEIVIQVDEDRRQVVDKDSAVAQQSSSEFPNRPPRSWSVKIFGLNKFRSNSTGHSLVQPGENLERFTLKLPAEVRKEMIHRASLKRTGSCAASSSRNEGTSKTSVGEEGSSRGGRYFRRLEKLDTGAKSDRWVFFTRGLSLKSPKVMAGGGGGGGGGEGEGSVSSSRGSGRRIPVRLPSFNCLQEPKSGDEITQPFSNNPGSSPV